MRRIIVFLVLLALGCVCVSQAATLNAGSVLTAGQTVYSDNGKYAGFMQGDGNFVVYRLSDMTALWSTQTSGHSGSFIQMQYDGNFVLYDSASRPLWNSQTHGSGAGQPYFTVSNVGQALVLSNIPVWATWTMDGTQQTTPPVIFPNGSRTNMDGTSYFQNNGTYRLAFQTDGNLVLYKNGAVAWKTGTSNKGVTQAVMSNSQLVMMRGTDGASYISPYDDKDTYFLELGFLSFQSDGNVVIYAPSPLWSAPTDDAPAPVTGVDPRCHGNPPPDGCLGLSVGIPVFPF